MKQSIRCCVSAMALLVFVRLADAGTPSAASAALSATDSPPLPGKMPAVSYPVTHAYSSAPRGQIGLTSLNSVANSSSDGGSCCLESCGCCCDPCGAVIGGVGLYYMQPFFSNNPAVSFFQQGTGPGSREDIRQHMGTAPLFWVGYMFDSGLGVRARWWFFRQGTEQSYDLPQPAAGTLTTVSAAPLGSVLILDNAQAFAVTSRLQLHVVDLEGFQDTTFGNWNLLFAGGLGYTDLRQNYNAYGLGAPGARNIPLFSSRSFSGLGPVLALEARRQLFDSGFNLYSSARGRILFGSAEQTVTGGPELNGSQRSGQSALLPVGELELGVEYGRMFGQSRLFGQVAMIGQEWLGAGNASGAVRGGPPTTIPIFGSEDHSNLGFFGVSFRLGLNF